MLPPGHEAAVSFAKPELSLPADILDGFGWGFQSQLEMATDLSWIAVRPGAFHQRPAGMGVPGFGDGTLSASRTRGIFRGDQAQEFHQFSRMVKAREVTERSDCRDGHDTLHATQGLEGRDHRAEAPGLDLLVEFLFQALETFGVFVDRSDICLKDDLLSRCVTDHFTQPPQVSWALSSPARRAAIVSEQKGFEPELGRFEIAEGIFASPAAVADGFVFQRGDIEAGEVT
jgi:hypothetical protein